MLQTRVGGRIQFNNQWHPQEQHGAWGALWQQAAQLHPGFGKISLSKKCLEVFFALWGQTHGGEGQEAEGMRGMAPNSQRATAKWGWEVWG